MGFITSSRSKVYRYRLLKYHIFVLVSTSTPSTYEVMMRAPFSTPIITTPAYETNAEPTLIEKEFKTNRNVFNNKSEQLNEVNNDVPHNGFFGFLQAIQQNLLKSVSHESKISVLMNLRDTLLSNLREYC